jgi:hypothetical protein
MIQKERDEGVRKEMDGEERADVERYAAILALEDVFTEKRKEEEEAETTKH